MYLNVQAIGSNILERYIGEDGTEHRRKVTYEPTLFTHSNKPTGFKDIYGKFCKPKKFDTMNQARQWKKETEGMMEVLGMDDFGIAYIADHYPERAPNLSQIRIANIDIEVPAPEFPSPNEVKWEIKTIVHYDSILDEYHLFGIPKDFQNWSRKESVIEKDILDKVKYHECSSERDLLQKWLAFWKEFCPNVVTGWNIEGFDLPYIGGRISDVLGETALKSMSPWNRCSMGTKRDTFGNETNSLKIVGVDVLDYLDLYKKFTFNPRANFRLDYIGLCEVKQQKLEFKQSGYLEFYNEDYQRFCDYNIMDVELVKRIDEKLRLLQLAITMGYYAGINFDVTLATLKPWDAIIFNNLKKTQTVVPHNARDIKEKFIGAYVKEPIPGYYLDIIAFDLTSLYPKIIDQCNISPETIRGHFVGDYGLLDQIEALSLGTFKIPHGEFSSSANGMLYTKDFKGVIPIEIDKVFRERKKHKGKMLEAGRNKEQAKRDGDKKAELHWASIETQEDVEQMTRKIQINSLYGALGNQYFRFYNKNNAEAVTSFGQLAIKWVARAMNKFLNEKCKTENVDYIIYGDTDSIYVDFNVMMKKIGRDHLTGNERVDVLDKLGKLVEKAVINPAYDELTVHMNNKEKCMFMDREVIAITGFFLAKKRYALNVWDNEGTRYAKPKLKILGLETQRSSTPVMASDELKACIDIILQKDEKSLQEHVVKVKKQWMAADYPVISYVSSANNILKYGDSNMMPMKGCPGHIKGVLAYNRTALARKFDAIQEGEKVALVKLKEPNRYGVPVMAYPSGAELPNEIDPVYLKSVIDYNILYKEKFLGPLESICTAIKWDYEKSYNLSSFFG